MTRTFIIAEAGVNHNGDPGLALKLVDAAAEAGADAVKFQAFRAELVAVKAAPKADYQIAATGSGEGQLEMLRRLQLDDAAYRRLADRAKARGLTFLCSPFDAPSVDLVLSLGVPAMKIPSGEIVNLPLLRRIGASGLPVILSTGMAEMAEIEAAVAALLAAGTPRDKITLLHCNTEYPTPFADVNLRVMETLRRKFGMHVGYSDHTPGIEAAVAAVALGAEVIEKHLTLDHALPGPDHKASLEPPVFKAMVTAIRHVEEAMGNPDKSPSPSEAHNRSSVRRSLVAARAIRAGEKFGPHNVVPKRPAGGISPMRWDEVMGRVARRDFAADEPIEL